MSSPISYKFKNSIQGALAGGGDPATSPLYVFGPFLSLIVGAGVAQITFGASIWLAVFTVIFVSAMYRYVMKWITDGSGGSGLSEEEFGGWAVKINAAITVIEYTLTFLVSIAALVTFIVDRVAFLNTNLFGLEVRSLIAIAFSILVAFAVNRGPRVASKFFGPATALLLIFLWMMIGTVIWKFGFKLPDFNFAAFDSQHLKFTLGGFARILALMTGIEIFANLVASYEGNLAQRSRRAYESLVIIMGTTVITMIIVGPAILTLSNPLDISKSVFTQTMDALLPAWLSYTGTLIGIAILLSAAASSAQGLQNLALGLRARHYIPAKWGQRNKFDVPSFPSWAQVFIVVLAFLLFGTHEQTYLALYAAGVFILLSLTGWAAAKRFFRQFIQNKNAESCIGIFITVFSAIFVSLAAFIIFEERFMDGAWSYLIMVPALCLVFNYFRKRLGSPPESIDVRLSSVISARQLDISTNRFQISYRLKKILVPLSGSLSSEVAFHAATNIAAKFKASIYPLHIVNKNNKKKRAQFQFPSQAKEQWSSELFNIKTELIEGDVEEKLLEQCEDEGFDLICISSKNLQTKNYFLPKSLIYKIIYATTSPILIFRPTDNSLSRSTNYNHILVPLDCSGVSEQILPYVLAWATQYESKVTLICVPETDGNLEIVENLKIYLENIRVKFFSESLLVECVVEGSGPARTIISYIKNNDIDLIAMASHGSGGLARQNFVKLGSVTESILLETYIPMLFISAR